MSKRFRRAAQLLIIATSLMAMGASNTKCEGSEDWAFRAFREIFSSIEALEEAVCEHYELSGDTPPDFCPEVGPCGLPADPGPCEAAIPRWYFDEESGQCERFIYGGCRGNENNFVSKAECEGVCMPCDIDCAPHQVCRRNELCNEQSCDPEYYCADTCRGVECEEGERCELRYVQCVRAPCPPVAMCVPDERPDPCDDVVCADDEVCWYPTLYASADATFSSSVILSSTPVTDLEIRPRPECLPLDPCENKACREGQVCKPRPRFCGEDSPSCPPVGACVPDFSCENMECPEGQACAELHHKCLTDLCPSTFMCVPVIELPPPGSGDCELFGCPEGEVCETVPIECSPGNICIPRHSSCVPE